MRKHYFDKHGNYLNDLTPCEIYSRGYDDGYADAKTEYAQPHGEWIPISEAQPEANGWYITSTMYGSVYTDHWCIDHFDRTETVLAWMNLPEPYKRCEKNEEDLDDEG